jgi:type I restriction enzyme M protein
MNEPAKFNNVISFLWAIAADVLCDLFGRRKYPDVILPMSVLRLLDAILEPTKKAVLEAREMGDSLKIKPSQDAFKSASAPNWLAGHAGFRSNPGRKIRFSS